MAGGGGEQDLNLVPYMDILVNLMLFMLVVTAYIVELREAPVLAPAYKTGGSTETDPEDKPKPFITVGITTKSFAILGSTDAVPAAELVKNGDQYPYKELAKVLRDYKGSIEGGVADNLVITADSSVPYRVVVATMDVVRQDTQGALFPGVTLGLAVK